MVQTTQVDHDDIGAPFMATVVVLHQRHKCPGISAQNTSCVATTDAMNVLKLLNLSFLSRAADLDSRAQSWDPLKEITRFTVDQTSYVRYDRDAMKTGECKCTNAKDEATEGMYKRKYYYRLQMPMLYKDRKSVIYTCRRNATNGNPC